MAKNNKRKAFVLGLDGGTWEILDSLIYSGKMPYLKNLVDNGASGILRSTIPHYTAPAWVSCTTGVNPGKHGVFGFTIKKNGIVEGEFVDSKMIRSPRLWDFLNYSGKTSGIINVPITFPATPINGFLIPCFMTPLGKKDYTYPTEIYEKYLKTLGYIINVRMVDYDNYKLENIKKIISDIKEMAIKRYAVTEALWKEYQPDFTMVVFTCIDKLQHILWKCLDEKEEMYHTPFAKKIRPQIIEVYELIDSYIGKILDLLDDNTSFYVVSDHGFCPQKKVLFINKWLEKSGFLHIKKPQFLYHWFHKKLIRKQKFYQRNVEVMEHPIYRFIDKQKSSFIGSDPYEQGIYYLKDTSNVEYKDSLRKIIIQLKKYVDSNTGKKAFKKVYTRDELYSGDFVSNAPDIVLEMNDFSCNLIRGFPVKNRIIKKVKDPSGCHHPDGIFVAYGKDIDHRKRINANIVDITPTILYDMELPISNEFDGDIVKSIFREKARKKKEVKYIKDNIGNTWQNKEVNYTQDEEKEIAARLSDLGYFD